MADTTVTMNTLTAFDTEIEYAVTAATAEGANTAEVFDIIPTKAGTKLLISINNVATDQGAIAWSIAAGTMWAANAAKTGSVAQGKKEILQIDTGKYQGASGIIKLTLTPATGKILKTNHLAEVGAIEMV